MSDTAPTRPASRLWALGLLLVLVFATSWSQPEHADEDRWTAPARALELVVPDLFAEIRPSEFIELNMTRAALLFRDAVDWESRPDAGGRVDDPPASPIEGTEHDVETPAGPTRPADVPLPPHPVPYVGLLPLLLALLGVLAGNNRLAWAARLIALLAVTALWLGRLHEQHIGPGTDCTFGWPATLLMASQVLLVLAAVCGLAWLHGLDDEHDGASAPIAVGSLAVLVCGALMVLAAQVGTSDPAGAVSALTERLLAAGAPEPTRPALLATAEHLTRVLEEAALVSFACMSALLLHLKGRGRLTAVVLLAVALLDVARPLTGRWMDLAAALF